LPGVYITYDRQYHYLGTRGFGLPGDFNTRVLLNIDGNRVNDAVFDQAYMGRDFPVDLDLIERIEFIPGPGGAVYGQNAMFAVVNVITRRGADVGGTELSASYQHPQSSRSGRASWGQMFSNGVDALVSVSALRSSGENRLIDFGGAGVSGTAVDFDGERDGEFFARIAQGRWASVLSFGDRRKDDPLGTYLSDPLIPGQYQRDRHLLAQLQYQNSFAGDTLHLSGRLFSGQERYSAPFSFGGTPTVQTGSSNWTGGEVRLLSTAWARHKFMAGLELQANTRQDQTYEDLAAPANNVMIPGSGSRTGAYAQDEWALGGNLSATLGLRADHNKTVGNTLSPRVGLIWNITPASTWKALYGRASRAPNVFEHDFSYVNQVANAALDGENIDTFELGFDHRATDGLALRASVYRWAMRKLITLETDPATGLAQYQNGETVHADGVELSAIQTWAWRGRLRGSASYQHPRGSNDSVILNSPAWLGKLNYSQPVAALGLSIGYELRYASKRVALDGTNVDGYWLSNLNLATDKLAKGLDVSLGLYNLFDTKYAYPGSRNNWQNALEQDGRSVRAQLSFGF